MNCRELSKAHWKGEGKSEDINTGSLQRIADAVEVVARNYNEIILERNRYREWWENLKTTNARLQREKSALHGVITKLHKKGGGK